jgi:hypothetical protein
MILHCKRCGRRLLSLAEIQAAASGAIAQAHDHAAKAYVDRHDQVCCELGHLTGAVEDLSHALSCALGTCRRWVEGES